MFLPVKVVAMIPNPIQSQGTKHSYLLSNWKKIKLKKVGIENNPMTCMVNSQNIIWGETPLVGVIHAIKYDNFYTPIKIYKYK